MSYAPIAPELLSVKPPHWDRALSYLNVVWTRGIIAFLYASAMRTRCCSRLVHSHAGSGPQPILLC
jgi:hypothetical protein